MVLFKNNVVKQNTGPETKTNKLKKKKTNPHTKITQIKLNFHFPIVMYLTKGI